MLHHKESQGKPQYILLPSFSNKNFQIPPFLSIFRKPNPPSHNLWRRGFKLWKNMLRVRNMQISVFFFLQNWCFCNIPHFHNKSRNSVWCFTWFPNLVVWNLIWFPLLQYKHMLNFGSFWHCQYGWENWHKNGVLARDPLWNPLGLPK